MRARPFCTLLLLTACVLLATILSSSLNTLPLSNWPLAVQNQSSQPPDVAATEQSARPGRQPLQQHQLTQTRHVELTTKMAGAETPEHAAKSLAASVDKVDAWSLSDFITIWAPASGQQKTNSKDASKFSTDIAKSNNKPAETPRNNTLKNHRSPSRLLRNSRNQAWETDRQQEPEQPERTPPPHELLIHLDLKGAPPRLSYLKQVIGMVARLGATGLLIEWEDKFPYWGPLEDVVAGTAYSRAEVDAILAAARAHNLTVVPLVQTFGHVEFVLKLKRFSYLREDPSTPQALCPSRKESAALVHTMIDQMMAVHGNISRVHMGSDEVFVLGRCQLCAGRSKHDLLLGHVSRTARYIRERYNATPIMWEDMLRNVPTFSLKQYGMDKLVEPMMWWYTPNVRKYVAPMVWRHAERTYSYVWGAGAYKGAFGSSLFVAPIDRHVQNNLDWAELLAEEDARMSGGVRGLVLTGWSRYDHMATMAELLPAALPSLAFSMAAVQRGALDNVAAEAAQRALGCGSTLPLSELPMPYMYDQMNRCSFPGQSVYMLMHRFNATAKAARQFLKEIETGHQSSWLGRYPARHSFSSILNVQKNSMKLERQRRMVLALLAPLYRGLVAVFPVDIALEWLEHRVYPIIEDLDVLKSRWEKLTSQKQTFAVRPLRNYPEQLKLYMDQYVFGWRDSAESSRRQPAET